MKKAIVLCSGGLDSVTTTYYIKKRLKYDKIIILFFDYSQKSVKEEKRCARLCSKNIKAEFKEIKLPELNSFSTSLINIKGRVNKVKRKNLKDTREESMHWYVPYRNAVFLTYALCLAESLYLKKKKKYEIFVGFKSEGFGGYPDTSLEFIKAMEIVGKFGHSNYKIKAPLIKKDKSDLIILGRKLGVNFENAFSCYIGKKKHCGYCLACRLRQEGFYWANIKDPTKYEVKMKDFRLASQE